MRGLTLWQPMAWGIAEGYKPVENRPWALPDRFVGQRFAVHAGKRYDRPWAQMIHEDLGLTVPPRHEITLGAVVAVATFAACIDAAAYDALTPDRLRELGMPGALPAIVDWWSGPYGFLLRDVVKLRTPIPCRGFQGLWTLAPEVEKAVTDQVGVFHPAGSVASVDEVRARFRKIVDAEGKFTPRHLMTVAEEFQMTPAALGRLLEDLELLAPTTFDQVVAPSGVLEQAANAEPLPPSQCELFVDPADDDIPY